MKYRALILSISLTGSLIGPAVAQDRGSEKDQDACTPDVFRLCSDFIPDEGPIVQCLKSKGPQLSPACHQVFFTAPAAAPDSQVADSAPQTSPAGAKKHRRVVRHAHHGAHHSQKAR